LWMGVPVVTFAGAAHRSRVGVSILAAVGLDDLVATTDGEYVEKAAALAADRERLWQLRGELRDRMRESPLMDAAGFARDLEMAYREMWRRECRGELASRGQS